ncbi:hypothetical protein LEP1GSC016_1113 [Leptospira borgpetersenii serovar Hardjo-bovis str. Sponselee]|uniref:Uncharacterized protein n=1 Tax=Leptospira borgpetersenii serovar Hardjo-bovis str. Sponselee TaxID=1303729 RepID=M6C2E0_LEPBO|nr:hypothetical protein LEP1GSC016_1113 [Leptospira borgpetersenii serovar Hardjo-bovis str. Sponselee]
MKSTGLIRNRTFPLFPAFLLYNASQNPSSNIDRSKTLSFPSDP